MNLVRKETFLTELSQRIYLVPGMAQKKVISVDPEATLAKVVYLMREHHIGDVIVVEDRDGRNTPIGVITDRDIAIEALQQGKPLSELRVRDYMSKGVALARTSDDVFAMIRIMKHCGVSRLPIVDEEGGIVGIVSAKNLFELLLEGLNDLAGLAERRQRNEQELRH